MNDINYTGVLVQTLKKKIVYIVILGILMGIALGAVKVLFSDIANRHGDYYFIRTVQVQSAAVPSGVQDNFDYREFLNSPGNYYQFLRKAGQGDFNFSKIDSAWNRKSQAEQMDWLKEKLQVTSFRDGVFQVSLHLDANITRDVDYMKKHGQLLTDDFVQVSEQSIKKVKPDAVFKIVGQEQSYPVVEPVNRKKMMLKFGVIGFVAGLFGSTVCFYLWALRKEYGKVQG